MARKPLDVRTLLAIANRMKRRATAIRGKLSTVYPNQYSVGRALELDKQADQMRAEASREQAKARGATK